MTRFVSGIGVAVFLCGAYASAQSAISAHSGMVHYVEGKVLLEGQPVDPKFGEFPEVKNNQVLETAEGRAEVLLTPGVFLRIAENSSFKMLSNKLSDTALEVLSGSAIIEVDELLKDNAITLRYKDATIALSRAGLYRLDAEPGRLRVFDGEADVTYGLKTIEAHKGKQVELSDGLLASSFDTKDSDAFYRWVARRSQYIATANVSAARAAGTQGLMASVPCQGVAATSPNPSALIANTPAAYCNPYGYGYGYGNGFYSPYSTWAWDPYYGMFTFLPGYGYGYSPFGYTYYSPMTVGSLYVPGATGASGYRGAVTPRSNNRPLGPTALAGSRPGGLTAVSAIRAGGQGIFGASPRESGVGNQSSGSSGSGSSSGRASSSSSGGFSSLGGGGGVRSGGGSVGGRR